MVAGLLANMTPADLDQLEHGYRGLSMELRHQVRSNLAHGAWDRFRTALAHARDAYAIDDATAAALIAEGFCADDRGRGLEPPRTLVWITDERAARLAGARPIALRLNAELLAARCLALVPFP